MNSATWSSRAAPLAVACAGTLVLVAALFWPLPLHLSTAIPESAFGGGHAWTLDHMGQMLWGDLPWTSMTNRLGFPAEKRAQFLAWLPAIFAAPLQPILGPLGAFNTVLLLSPMYATIAAYCWIRQATDAGRWVAALASFLYGTCPYLLANLAAGNIDKAQIFLYPAWLALAWWTWSRRRPWLYLPAFVAMGAAMAFTEPYFGLFLPLFAGPLLMLRAWRERSVRAAALAFAMLAASGAGMWPANDYYDTDSVHDRSVLFEPSHVTRHQTPPALQDPVATFENLLVGPMGPSPTPRFNKHVTTLGLALLLAAVWVSRRRSRGRAEGLVILILGLVIAFGPQLMAGGQWRLEPVTLRPFYLPMQLLEELGYPLKRGGQYYRAAPIPLLGLATLLAAGLAGRSRRDKRLAALLIPLSLVQGVWASGPWWPVPLAAFPGGDLPMQLRDLGEPGDGVAVLPLEVEQHTNEVRAAQAALYRHPSTVVVRHVLLPEMLGQYPWALGMGMQGVQAYQQAGIRFVLLHKNEPPGDDPPWLHEDAQREMLGAPILENDEVAIFEVPPG